MVVTARIFSAFLFVVSLPLRRFGPFLTYVFWVPLRHRVRRASLFLAPAGTDATSAFAVFYLTAHVRVTGCHNVCGIRGVD